MVAGDDWVEVVLDSFFENSRTGGDELWGTALVDGDGSTNTLVSCSCSLLHDSSLEQLGCWWRLGSSNLNSLCFISLRCRTAWLLLVLRSSNLKQSLLHVFSWSNSLPVGGDLDLQI
jgi:hypothetical protein